MSTSTPDPNKIYKSTFHWRNNSGELDVFEAARYFSSAADQAYRADRRHQVARPARRSLDVPIMIRSNPLPSDYNHHHVIDQKRLIQEPSKKFKQPSSPGGRLASFLNSLFNQTSLKKKKSKSGAAAKDMEEESPSGRRKRRSSISHFRITTASKSAAADKGSGFRTPPPCADTPTKSYKELPRFGDHHAVRGGEKKDVDSEKIVVKVRSPEKELRKWSEEDDGGESDSSSDLFDLPNHDLDFFSSGLPVYETTHIQRIKIATPIPT